MTRETGHWEGPDDTPAMLAIARSRTPWAGYLDDILDSLERAGVLVRTRYYVPSAAELYDLYRTIHELHRSLTGHVRWVMCRETHDALGRRYVDQRMAVPGDIPWAFRPDGEALTEVPVETVAVVDYRDMTARLFGIPIRIDPAARSPLIEIDSEATVRNAGRTR